MRLIYKLFNTGALISLASMILVVAIQVVTRYLLESTPHWTEEAARVFFIYSVAFGTGTGIINGDFIRLDLISKYLSPQLDRILDIVAEIAVTCFGLIIMLSSIEFITLGMDERSPALRITMGFVFVSISIIGLSIVIFTLNNLYNNLKGKNISKL